MTVLELPTQDTSVGDLDERSRSSDSRDWPMFSYSQSQTWDGCEERWNISYRKGWTTKRESFALSVGTLVHEGMDIYYGNENRKEALDLWTKDLLAQASMDQVEEISRAIYILHLYSTKWAPVEDRGYLPIATELHVAAPFLTPTGRNFWLQGYIDLLMKFDNKFEIWDHKTTGTGFWKMSQFQMNPQTPLYVGILREIGTYKVHATVLNELNTYSYKNWKDVGVEKLFARPKIIRTDKEITSSLKEFSKLVDELIDRYEKPRRSLGSHCAKCDFQEVCLLGLKGIPTGPILKSKFSQKNPNPVSEVIKEEADGTS